MARPKGSCGTLTLLRTRINYEIPPMPACWDSHEDWEGWCKLMASTYRQDYSHNWTLQDALKNYCLDCVPGVFQNLMIRAGRCRKYRPEQVN